MGEHGAAAAVERLGVRAYARHRGCSAPSVVKAIRTRRLVHSVDRDARGHPSIDPALADVEWLRNTDPRRLPIEADIAREAATRAAEGAAPLASAPVAAWFELTNLLCTIEAALSKVFRQVVALAPDAPSDRWAALYDGWGQLPEALKRLEDELARYVPLREDEEDAGAPARRLRWEAERASRRQCPTPLAKPMTPTDPTTEGDAHDHDRA